MSWSDITAHAYATRWVNQEMYAPLTIETQPRYGKWRDDAARHRSAMDVQRDPVRRVITRCRLAGG